MKNTNCLPAERDWGRLFGGILITLLAAAACSLVESYSYFLLALLTPLWLALAVLAAWLWVTGS